MTLFLTEQDCEKVLSITKAIPVIEEVFRMAGEGTAQNVPRVCTPTKNGKSVNFGLAALHGKQLAGFKLQPSFGAPVKRIFDYLYSMETGELLAVIQADSLGKFRTAATSAVAVKYLSPPNANVLGVYGAGRHAATHIEAICAVRPIQTVYVYCRSQESREAFCGRMSKQLGVDVRAAPSPESVPQHSQIIVTITSSRVPVLLMDWIAHPVLVVGAGSNEWYEQEIDEKVVGAAKLVVADDKEHAKIESGDLLFAVSQGLLRWDLVTSLGDVVAAKVKVPDFASGIILFESHGLAIEDVAIAARAYELAKAQGLGRQIDLGP